MRQWLKRSEYVQKRSGGDGAEEESVCVDSLSSSPGPLPNSLLKYIYSTVVHPFSK